MRRYSQSPQLTTGHASGKVSAKSQYSNQGFDINALIQVLFSARHQTHRPVAGIQASRQLPTGFAHVTQANINQAYSS
jgi:hypothetical protein